MVVVNRDSESLTPIPMPHNPEPSTPGLNRGGEHLDDVAAAILLQRYFARNHGAVLI